MYFHATESIASDTDAIPIIFKASSATRELSTVLRDISINNIDFLQKGVVFSEGGFDRVATTLSRGLENIGHCAVTWTAFSDYADEKTAEYIIRKEISSRYTPHYMEFIGGDIITGIREINYYDFLNIDFPTLDYEILRLIILFLLPSSATYLLNDALISEIIDHGDDELHTDLATNIRIIIRSLYIQRQHKNEINYEQIRLYIKNTLSSLFQGTEKPKNINAAHVWLLEATRTISNIVDKFSNMSYQNRHSIDVARNWEAGNMVKILICVSTDIEMVTLQEYSSRYSLSMTPRYDGNLVYFDLGKLHGIELYAVRTQMGSGSIGGSAFTVEEAIRKINLNNIIAIGLAFGLKEKKQSIGDVLVSLQVQCYELQRIGENAIIPRGDKVSANPGLVSRFDAAKLSWKESKIHTGLVLSGDKLVDSGEFKRQLLDNEPEAIGGEMEAAGIVSACERHNRPWVIVKDICDWGENKHDSNQKLACSNAIGLFFHVLRLGGLGSV